MPQAQTHHHPTIWRRAVGFIRLAIGMAMGKLILILAVIGIGVNTWIFVEVADEVTEGESQRFDNMVIKALRDPENLEAAIGPAWLSQVARDITALGSTAVLMIVTFTVLGYLVFERKWAWTGVVAIASFGGMILTWIMKESFERARPDLVPHLDHVSSYSFPSGHAMSSAVIYLTLGVMLARLVKKRRVKAYFLGVAMALTFLVGVSRIFVGVHYPTDVVAGWCAGLTWAGICFLAATWLEWRSRMRGGPVDLAAEKAE